MQKPIRDKSGKILSEEEIEQRDKPEVEASTLSSGVPSEESIILTMTDSFVLSFVIDLKLIRSFLH